MSRSLIYGAKYLTKSLPRSHFPSILLAVALFLGFGSFESTNWTKYRPCRGDVCSSAVNGLLRGALSTPSLKCVCRASGLFIAISFLVCSRSFSKTGSFVTSAKARIVSSSVNALFKACSLCTEPSLETTLRPVRNAVNSCLKFLSCLRFLSFGASVICIALNIFNRNICCNVSCASTRSGPSCTRIAPSRSKTSEFTGLSLCRARQFSCFMRCTLRSPMSTSTSCKPTLRST